MVDREDADYFLPELKEHEASLARAGAIPLRDLAGLAFRKANAERVQGPIRYIDIASIDSDSGTIHPTIIDFEDLPSRAKLLVHKGDLLVSTVRPDRGAVACIPDLLEGATCSTGFAVFEPVGILPLALLGFLRTRSFIMQAVRRCTASMYPVVAAEDLLEVLVPRSFVDNGQAIDAAYREVYADWERMLDSLQAADALSANHAA